ncbi:MAG TPA: class I SAM-dependent methyltransferase [Acetivibrio sp.]|nr:class I SAM-dependent methyltransferase [Acetivibrio sp.]
MDLKGRLGLIADMVPQCDVVCDIGTDHAYIPIYLVMNNRCKRAVASDIRKGPIKVADKNIEKYNLRNYIDTRVGNGLETVRDGEEDTIIIAGMGGLIISGILEEGFETVKKANSLIIQPMYSIELVRKWLYENGFEIYDERLSKEDRRIYNVLAAKWTGSVQKKEEIYYYIGEKLFENKDRLLESYIQNKLRQLNKIICEMEKMNDKNSALRLKNESIREGLSRLLRDYHDERN